MERRIEEFHYWWAEEPFGEGTRMEWPNSETEAALMGWSAHWQQVQDLKQRIQELEGQHKGLVIQNALLRQRPDLPVERLPVASDIANITDMIIDYENVLKKISEYVVEDGCACNACDHSKLAAEVLKRHHSD